MTIKIICDKCNTEYIYIKELLNDEKYKDEYYKMNQLRCPVCNHMNFFILSE